MAAEIIPLIDLVDVLERYMDACATECLAMPGHESSCQCVNHLRSRAIHDEAAELLLKIKGA